ncbi:MAG TPA: 5-oxoprolinase subunit PxpB [Saprospiraceae bacterium]|nr:5-oxoprolinase subunit PxpB [Saprospiraceae bacterium]
MQAFFVMISITPFGDTALLINFEQRIDRDIHHQVLAMQDALMGIAGIRYMIPAYCSLTVAFDLQVTSAPVLHAVIRHHISQLSKTDAQEHILQLVTRNSQHIHSIPICYHNDFALDIKAVSLQIGKTPDEIIKAHLDSEFYVYMLGFMPGFAYMGDMPEEFSCHRKSTPRTRVPAGSVGLSGRQTGIYPFETPGGWQLIGRTPVKMFDPSRENAALLHAGDMVRFKRISLSDFQNHWVK